MHHIPETALLVGVLVVGLVALLAIPKSRKWGNEVFRDGLCGEAQTKVEAERTPG